MDLTKTMMMSSVKEPPIDYTCYTGTNMSRIGTSTAGFMYQSRAILLQDSNYYVALGNSRVTNTNITDPNAMTLDLSTTCSHLGEFLEYIDEDDHFLIICTSSGIATVGIRAMNDFYVHSNLGLAVGRNFLSGFGNFNNKTYIFSGDTSRLYRIEVLGEHNYNDDKYTTLQSGTPAAISYNPDTECCYTIEYSANWSIFSYYCNSGYTGMVKGSELNSGQLSYPTNIIAIGDYAYVSTSNGLVIVDIKDAMNMSIKSRLNLDDGETYTSMTYRDGVCYLAKYTNGGIIAVCVKNPSDPVRLDTVDDTLFRRSPALAAKDGVLMVCGYDVNRSFAVDIT